MPEHPENDLTADADYANRPRPVPRTFDELADAPDPALIAAANRASSRQAVAFAVVIIIASIIVGSSIAIASRMIGGPLCESGQETWLCSPTQQLIWAIGAAIVPFFGMIGAGVIMVRKLNRYLRWRPWMGTFWVLTPHCMAWLFSCVQVLYYATSG